VTDGLPLTPLQTWELLTGVRLYHVSRYESPSRHFVLGLSADSKTRFEIHDIRSAARLNSWLPQARAMQGNRHSYPPFDSVGARHLTKVLHTIAESDSAQCEIINPQKEKSE
jgi:hypothetical protein